MKIIVKRNEQQAEVTFDLKDVIYSYAIREAIQTALKIEGFTQDCINEVFNLNQDEDVKCKSE